jgi:hypothetical protein
MDIPNQTGAKGLRGWWLTPPRPGMHRLINPWAYRHLRVVGVTHIVGASVGAVAAAVCVSYHAYEWALFFLLVAALNLAGGCWYLMIARSAPAPGPDPGQTSVPGTTTIVTRLPSIDDRPESSIAA